jgi:glycolate oxidase
MATADLASDQQRDWAPVVAAFTAALGKDKVVRRKEELLVYECDGLTSYRQRPAVVVLPHTTDEVAAAVKICHQFQVPFVARGAGTGLSGGALPIPDSVLIVTATMRQILDIDYDNQRVVVQPGVVNNWVTQAVSGAGFYYAPDPPVRAFAPSVAMWPKIPVEFTA